MVGGKSCKGFEESVSRSLMAFMKAAGEGLSEKNVSGTCGKRDPCYVVAEVYQNCHLR